jgi:hypothetical protein
MNPSVYKYNPKTVSNLLVGIPDEEVTKISEFGKDFMPDVPDWSGNAPNPWQSIVVHVPSTFEASIEDDREEASESMSLDT